MSKLLYEFNKASFEFNPRLSEEEYKLINDLVEIGHKIKDRDTLKKFLTYLFFQTSLRQQDF